MNKSEIISNELQFFAHYPKFFNVNEVSEYVDLTVEPQFIQEILNRDSRLLPIGHDLGPNACFISKSTLINWLVYVSINLAKTKKSCVENSQFLTMMDSLGETGGETSEYSKEIIEFGQNFGLVAHGWRSGEYFLPISHLISFTSYSSKALFNLIRNLVEQKNPSTKHSMLEYIGSAFSKLKEKEAYITIMRSGLADRTLTLQQIGDELGCTRTRIQQIEKKTKSYGFIVRPLLTALLGDVIARKGSLIYEKSSKMPIVKFIVKCLNIPYLNLPKIGLVIIGTSQKRLQEVKFENYRYDKRNMITFLEQELQLPLSSADLKSLAEQFESYLEKKHTFIQRLYLTLQHIGKPAHYSTIADTHNNLFQEKPCADRSVLSALSDKGRTKDRERCGIVWIGAKGMYALKEWGYERPTKGLYELTFALFVSI